MARWGRAVGGEGARGRMGNDGAARVEGAAAASSMRAGESLVMVVLVAVSEVW